eukprot:m.340011 g.340011  ORF g.340011 m.340011 type:complete len:915 (-) comp55758_c0_seq1:878-3622(-)
MEPTIETILACLDDVYNNPDNTKKAAGSEFLDQFRSSPHAWQIADQLLHGDYQMEVFYFAANTIRSKIARSFLELPEESHLSLRDSLFSHLNRFAEASSPQIVTQLAIAVADVAIYMSAWAHPAAKLIESFARLPVLLLDLLIALAEEADNKHLKIDLQRHREFEAELAVDCPQVFELCEYCLQNSSDADTQVKTFKCLSSFLRFAGSSGTHFSSSFLLPACFRALAVESLADVASDAICEAIFLSTLEANSLHLRPALLELLSSLREPYQECIRVGDDNLGSIFTTIFTELAVTSIEIIVDAPTVETFQYVEDVLSASVHPSTEIVQRTFTFWYRFSDLIDERCDSTSQAEREKLWDAFSPFFLRLYDNLSVLAQCPGGQDGLLSAGSPLGEFRRKFTNLLFETCVVPSQSSVIQQIMTTIWKEPQPTWQFYERNFYMLQCLANSLGEKHEKIGSQVLYFIASIPEDAHIQLRATTVELLEHLSKFISYFPEHIPVCFERLLREVQVPALADAAAFAILELCSQCRGKMLPHFSTLVQLTDYGATAMKPKSAMQLLMGLARVISHFPPADITECMQSVCTPFLSRLHTIVTDANSTGGPDDSLEKLATVYRNLNIPQDVLAELDTHPCFSFAQATWTVLSLALQRYQGDERTVEDCLHCLKWLIRCVGRFLTPIISEVVEQVAHLFATFRHSGCLYIAGIMMEIFLREPSLVEGLFSVLGMFVQTTFALITSLDDMIHHPSIVEDFMRMLHEVLRYQSLAFLQSAEAPACFQFAAMAMSMAHPKTTKEVADFLYAALSVPRTLEIEPTAELAKTLVMGLLDAFGQFLIENIMHGLTGGLPSSMSPDVGDVLWAYSCNSVEHLITRINEAPSTRNLYAHFVPERARLTFLNAMATERDHRKFSLAVRDIMQFFH